MKQFFFLAFFITSQLSALSTLAELQKQADRITEFPQNDSDNWTNPNYDSLYSSLAPSYFSQWYGRQTPIVSEFILLLNTMNKARAKQSDEYVQHIVVEPHARFVIFSDISGGFHSLVRALSFLHQEKYLNTDLTITKPNIYIVFNGNSISRGPYSIETLTTIMRLMQKNPKQVFYLKGEQEQYENWSNFNTRKELKYRISHHKKITIPFEKELNTFFQTLPRALYISLPQNELNVIRISPSHRNAVEIDETIVGNALANQQTGRIALKHTTTSHKSKIIPQVISIIESENWMKKHTAKEGLAYIGQDRGAAAWTVFSAPIEAYKKLLGFTFDAFALLVIADQLTASTITLYNRNNTKNQPFSAKKTYHVQSSLIIEKDGVATPTNYITVGSSMALVQGVPIMGQRTQRGMAARIAEENKKGGVHTQRIRSVIYNDNYTPSMTRKNINRLLKLDNTSIILLPVGSPTLASYLDYIRKGDVTVFFPITGGPQFRDPALKNIIHFRGTYADEVHALIDYMVKERAAKKFAFFYQDDAYGQGPLQAAHEELKKNGITSWTDVPYQRNSVNYQEQAAKIKAAQPDAIGLFSTAQATKELIRQIGIDFLTNRQLFGISFLAEASFRRFIDKHGVKVLFGAVVPNPKTSDLEIVKEYRAAMDANNYPYDVFSLEAYIATSILIDAMKHITPPITKEKILKKLEQLDNYKFKGLTLTFHPDRRDLAEYIWLESGPDQEWDQKKIKQTKQKETDNARSINTSRSEQLPKGSTRSTS